MSETKITISAQDLASEALKKVQESLKGTGVSVDDLSGSLSHFAKNAVEAFENPLGAVKSLGSGIASELLPSLGGAGIALGAAAAAAAVLGHELIALGTEAEAIGASIGRMGAQFNMPVGAVSDMRFAINAAGGDFDKFGDSMFTFQKRIEDNGDAVGKGLGKLGLSLDQIKGMRPDEQFLAISDAVRAAGGDVNKAAIAFEIFGKQGKDILPMLMKPLSELSEESRKLGATWSEADVAAARAFRSEVTKLGAETEEAWTVLGRDVAPVTNQLVIGWDRMKLAVANVALTAVEAATGFGYFGAAWSTLLHETEQGPHVFGEATVAIKEQKKELDNLRESIAATKAGFERYWGIATAGAPASLEKALALSDEMKWLDDETRAHIQTAEKAGESAKKWAEDMANLTSVGVSFQATLDGIDGSVVEAIKYYLAAGVSQEQLARDYGLTAAQVKAVDGSMKEGQASLVETNKRIEDFHHTGEEGAAAVAKSFAGMSFVLRDLAIQMGDVQIAATKSFSGMGMLLPDLAPQAKAHMDSFGHTLTDGMADLFQTEMPRAIQGAVQGGGNVIGSTMSAFGGLMGTNISESVGGALKNTLGKTLGGAIGDMIPMVGSLVGPLFSAIMGKFGPSQQELDGRKVEADFEKSLGGFQGMMDKVGAAYTATGRTAAQAQTDVKALMDAEKNGASSVQSMIDKINGAFTEQKAHAVAVSGGIDGILVAAKTVGGDFPAALRPMLAELEKLPGLTDDGKQKLLELTGAVKPNFADLTSRAKEYGLGLTELGPAFEQANISGRADKILGDFRALDEAGAHSDAVLHGMGGSINSLINDAIKYGSTLPTALEPLAEQLAKTGQLTDDAGHRLDDLSGVKFNDAGDPLAKGMSSLTDAINHLGDILQGLPGTAQKAADGIGAALGGIQAPEIPLRFSMGDLPRFGGDGSESFANEGFDLTRPTRAIVGDNPLQSESVLHASTVKDIVRASRQAAGGAGVDSGLLKGLRDDNAKLHKMLKDQGEQIGNMLRMQPVMLRHALRGM